MSSELSFTIRVSNQNVLISYVPMRATFPAHLIFLDLIMGKKNLWNLFYFLGHNHTLFPLPSCFQHIFFVEVNSEILLE
jgi:hypothetical protein